MSHSTEQNLLMNAVVGALCAPQELAYQGRTFSRGALARRASTTYGGNRRVYEALGYPEHPDFDMYNRLYTRGDVARAVVNAYPDESWRLRPTLTEDKNEIDDTPFEKKWKELSRSLNIYRYLHKIDRISGIGCYGVLWLGFDDAAKPSEPISTRSKHNLIFLRPFKEDRAEIAALESDTSSPRYGLPTIYTLKVTQPDHVQSSGIGAGTQSINVHHSRIIHVAEDTIDSDVYGTPRLMPVFNRLLSLELLAGGSAEMYWRGAFPGYTFKIDSDTQRDETDLEEAKEQITNFVHNLQRYIRLRGMEVQSISPQVVDPSKQVDVQITLIAAAKGIPKRILSGSERGELASSQDETSWTKLVEARRLNYVEPCILRPFIDKLIEVGALPPPKSGYGIAWPDLRESTPKDRAEIENTRATALARYADSPEAQIIVPPEMFLRVIMGFQADDIAKFEKVLRDSMLEDRLEASLDGDVDTEESAASGSASPPPTDTATDTDTGEESK